MAAHEKNARPADGGVSGLYKVKPKKEWGNGLGKRTAKNSVRTVFFNFKEYLSFFVALFVIQSMFWLVCVTTSTNVNHRYNVITTQYDCDIIIGGIDVSEKAAIENELFLKSFQNKILFSSYEFVQPDRYHDYYTLKVSLKTGKSAESFIAYYIENTGVGRENVMISYTPRYTIMENYVGATIRSGVLAAAFLVLLSVVLLMALYNVRINHFKFLYGIYMTCGAGFRKLFSTAVWEMLVISATTLAASFAAVYLTSSALYSLAGIERVYISAWMIPAVILLNLITAYFAVRAPMRHMSKKPPLSLIVAQDNSNLVSSPRRSFRIFNKTFPYHYELYSTWRFRKYFIGTLLTAVIFTSLFISGVYAGHMNKTDLEAAVSDADITVDFWDIDLSGDPEADFGLADAVDLMDEVMTDGVESVGGVRYSVWENSESATMMLSHILMRDGSLAGSSEYSTDAKNIEGYGLATNFVGYGAYDRHYIDLLCSLYEVEGDPYAVLGDSGKVIVTDTIYNAKNFDFEPGDRIYAARLLYRKKKVEENYLDRIFMLNQYLDCYVFDYREYEVAAVIRGYKDNGEIIVGMNHSEYMNLTGKTGLSKVIRVSLDSGIPQSEADKILEEINVNLSGQLGVVGIGYSIRNNYAALGKQLAKEGVSYPAIIAVSIMLLVLSPVVWFFSQVLFYLKREKEISLLRMFGAREKQLGSVYSFAGGIMAALAVVMTVLLSLATSYIMYKLFNKLLPYLGFTGGGGYDFYLSGMALLVSIAVSAACGFISSYIPYKIGKKRRETDYAGRLSGRS